MSETDYDLAYWLTYGVMPPTYKPTPIEELQKQLKIIATGQKGSV